MSRKQEASSHAPATARPSQGRPPWSAVRLLCAVAFVLAVARTVPSAHAGSVCFTPVKCVCPYGYQVKLGNPCQCVTCELGSCPHGVPQLYASCATLQCPAKRCKKQVTYTCGKMSITCPPA